jgi:aminobenzoyl-glutamate utilization protein B
MMTDTQFEVEFHDASSGMVWNDTIIDVFQSKMEQMAPISYTKEEEAFAQELAKTFPVTGESLFAALLTSDIKKQLSEFEGKLLIGKVLPIIRPEVTFPGGNDVGDVSQVTPTGQFIGVSQALGTPGHSWQAVAQHGMSIGHKGVLFAGKVLAASAIEFMQKPELVVQARQEFRKKTQGKPYVSLIPDEVKPHSIYKLTKE